jgi:hypothetical protein
MKNFQSIATFEFDQSCYMGDDLLYTG